MGFYYFSLFSWVVFAVYFVIAALIIIKVCEKNKFSSRWKASLLAVAFIVPWTEELWIAYSFGQFCRADAGKFVYKTVEVDGYYNDTYGGANVMGRIVGGPPYKFVESRDTDQNKFRRVERASIEEKIAALAWYANRSVREKSVDSLWITHPVNDEVQVTVETDTGFAWRITKIDKPTARYHYKFPHNHARVAYKVTKHEYVIIDSKTGDILGRDTSYGREAYWFFIHLDAPLMLCPAPGERPDEEKIGMLYSAVLKPITSK